MRAAGEILGEYASDEWTAREWTAAHNAVLRGQYEAMTGASEVVNAHISKAHLLPEDERGVTVARIAALSIDAIAGALAKQEGKPVCRKRRELTPGDIRVLITIIELDLADRDAWDNAHLPEYAKRLAAADAKDLQGLRDKLRAMEPLAEEMDRS